MKPVWILLFTLLAFGTLSLSAQQQPVVERVACTPSPTCKPSPECTPSPTCPPVCCLVTSATPSNQPPAYELIGKGKLAQAGEEKSKRAPLLATQEVKKPKAITLPSKEEGPSQ